MASLKFNKVCRLIDFPVIFSFLVVFCLVFGGVSGKEFPAESEDAPVKKEVIEVPPVDTNTLEKQETEAHPQPSETGPGLERDTDDPQDIVHTRELLSSMKPGPGVQWRLTMPVPLQETQPDLRRRRRRADPKGLYGVAREALQGFALVFDKNEAEPELMVDSRAQREPRLSTEIDKNEAIPSHGGQESKTGKPMNADSPLGRNDINENDKFSESRKRLENKDNEKAYEVNEPYSSPRDLGEISVVIDIVKLDDEDKAIEKKELNAQNNTYEDPKHEKIVERLGMREDNKTDMTPDKPDRLLNTTTLANDTLETRSEKKGTDTEMIKPNETSFNENFAITPTPSPLMASNSLSLWHTIGSWIDTKLKGARVKTGADVRSRERDAQNPHSIDTTSHSSDPKDEGNKTGKNDAQKSLNDSHSSSINESQVNTTTARETGGKENHEDSITRVKRRSRRRRKHHKLGKRDTQVQTFASQPEDQLDGLTEAEASREVRLEQDQQARALERVKRRGYRGSRGYNRYGGGRRYYRRWKRDSPDSGLSMDELAETSGEDRPSTVAEQDQQAETLERVKRRGYRGHRGYNRYGGGRHYYRRWKRSLSEDENAGIAIVTDNNPSDINTDKQTEQMNEFDSRIIKRERSLSESNPLSSVAESEDTDWKVKEGAEMENEFLDQDAVERVKRRSRRRRKHHKLGKRSVDEDSQILGNHGDLGYQGNPLSVDAFKDNNEEFADRLTNGDKLLNRIAREALDTVGSGNDAPAMNLRGDEYLDEEVDIGDADSGAVGPGYIGGAYVAGDDELGEDVDVAAIDGSGNELDTGGDLETGDSGQAFGIGDEDLDNNVVYEDAGEINEELGGSGELLGEADVAITPPVANVGVANQEIRAFDKDYDAVPPAEPAGNVLADKVQVPIQAGPLAKHVSNKNGVKIPGHGKTSTKKLRVVARKKPTLQEKEQDQKYEEQVKKLHNKDQVLKKTVAEIRRKVEGSTDERPHPKKLAKVMNEKKTKAAYQRVLDKAAEKKQDIVVNPEIENSQEDDLAKTMHRLEHKVDTVKTMIESRMAKKHPHKKIHHGSKHGRRHKRSTSENVGKDGSPLVLKGAVVMLKSNPELGSMEKTNVDIKPFPGIKDSFLIKPQSDLSVGSHNMNPKSPGCYDCVPKKIAANIKGNSHDVPSSQKSMGRGQAAIKGVKGGLVPLVQKNEPSLLSHRPTVINNSPPEGEMQGGIISMSIPIFTERYSDNRGVKGHMVKNERNDQASKSQLSHPNKSTPVEPYTKFHVSRLPSGFSVSAVVVSPPRFKQAPHLSAMLPSFPPTKRRLGELINKHVMLPNGDDTASVTENILTENAKNAGYLPRFSRENLLRGSNIHKMMDNVATSSLQHLKKMLGNLRTEGSSLDRLLNTAELRERSFFTKGLGKHLFGDPLDYDTHDKNRLRGFLEKVSLVGRGLTGPTHGIKNAEEKRMKKLLKHIMDLQVLDSVRFKRVKPIFEKASVDAMSQPPLQTAWHKLEELLSRDMAKEAVSSENRKQDHFQYLEPSSMPLYERPAQNRFAELRRTLEQLSNKASIIEKRLNIRKDTDDDSKRYFVLENKAFTVPGRGLFPNGDGQNPLFYPPTDSSAVAIPYKPDHGLMLNRNDVKIKQLEGLVLRVIRTLCGHRKRRLRRLRDLSFSHWMDEKEKEKNRQRQRIKPEKDPVTDEEYDLERQLKDLLARFPMSEAEFAMNNNLRRENSKIAASTDVLNAVIERNSEADQEEPVMGSSAAIAMLSYGARRRRHAQKSSSDANKPGSSLATANRLSKRNNVSHKDRSKPLNPSIDKFQTPHGEMKPFLDKNHRGQKVTHLSPKPDGRQELEKNEDQNRIVPPQVATTTTPVSAAPLTKPRTTSIPLTETGGVQPLSQAQQGALKRTKRKAMKREMPYGFGMLFGGDPDYFHGDFNEINEYDDYEGEENLLRRRLIGTPPYMSGYYTHSELFPGFYTYHPPGVYKRSVGDPPLEVSKKTVGGHPSEVSKMSDGEYPTRSKRSAEDHSPGVPKRSTGDKTQIRSLQHQHQKLLLQQQQQQQRYDDLDLDDSIVDVDDYEDKENFEDYEKTDDEDEDDQSDIVDDDDEDEDEDENESGAPERIQVVDNGENVEPDEEMVYVVEKNELNEAVEEPLSWGAWSVCSVTCGVGQRYRVSICGEDGEPCHGRRASEEMEVCEVQRTC